MFRLPAADSLPGASDSDGTELSGAERLPETEDIEAIVRFLTELSDQGIRTIPSALDCNIRVSSTHISKMFLTANRFLRQSYVYTEGTVTAYAPNPEGEMKATSILTLPE